MVELIFMIIGVYAGVGFLFSGYALWDIIRQPEVAWVSGTDVLAALATVFAFWPVFLALWIKGDA